MPFSKQTTSGSTRIFSFSTKNLAFSTFIFANLVSKCRGAKVCNQSVKDHRLPTLVKKINNKKWGHSTTVRTKDKQCSTLSAVALSLTLQELIRRRDSKCELFYDNIAHVLQNTKKDNLFPLTN